jgi:hypothetical protein
LIRALPRGSPCGSRIREIYPERSSAQVFIGGGSAGEHVEDVFDTDAHAADTGASAALLGVDRDPFHRSEHNAERKTLHPFFDADSEKSPVLDADRRILTQLVQEVWQTEKGRPSFLATD